MSVVKKKRLFSIIHFVESDVSNKKKCIDCVPSKWINSDPEMRQLMTKFMPPPYTAKRCATLHTLVKNNEDAQSKWPYYPVKILGSADTYFEAVSKMEKLKHENYVCTTDYNTDIDENEHNKKKNQEKAKNNNTAIYELSGKLSKRKMNSSSSEEETSIDEDEYETDESSIGESTPKRKRQHSSDIQNKENSCKNYKAKLSINPSFSTPAPDKVVKNIQNSAPYNISLKVEKYFKRILKEVEGFKYDQQQIHKDLNTLKDKFQEYTVQNIINPNQRICTHWTEENNIKWPLKTKEDFDQLNELLLDEEIRKDFMATIEFIIDSRTPISKNLLAVIRKFFHKDLATKFNCVKVTKEKFTLKPSLFYNCIIDVVMAKSKHGSLQEIISEKTLDKLIGVILTNARDWEKGRSVKNIKNVEERGTAHGGEETGEIQLEENMYDESGNE